MIEAVSEDFTLTGLQRVRWLVKRAAEWVGLAIDVIDNLVLAVSEVASNAIEHAGGRGHLMIWRGPGTLTVEISDRGPGLPARFTTDCPDPTAVNGRGLWLARCLFPDMVVMNHDDGLTVRFVAVRA